MGGSSSISAHSLLCLALVTVGIVSAVVHVGAGVSTWRRALILDDSKRASSEVGFRVTLRHVDAGKNLSKWERIQRGMKRGSQRLHKLNAMVLQASSESSSEVEAAVSPGNGEFLMELSIGTPPETYSAILDTGSDLIWTQCKPCSQCFNQPTPIYDPTKSSSFSNLPCSSHLCAALPQSTCTTDGSSSSSSSSSSCEYLYTYGDYSSTQGVMATETFTFGNGNGNGKKVSVPNVGFGCGEDNEGDGFSQGSGLVGLGRGPLSLVSQLKEPKFSYCLTSIDDPNKSSLLLMGSLAAAATSVSGNANANANAAPAIKTTPLIRNPAQPSFYYLSLQAISVGHTRLPIKKSAFALQHDGTGGLIIDSGTTITYLEAGAFHQLKNEFISQMKNLPVDDSGSTGLELCFTSSDSDVEVPRLTFHFDGGADLELPAENYFIADASSGLVCLAMGSSTSNGMSIFGNVQQQNMLVLHDLRNQTLSFIPTPCHNL